MALGETSVNISCVYRDAAFNISFQSILPEPVKPPRPSRLCAVLWFIHPLPSLHWFQYSPRYFYLFFRPLSRVTAPRVRDTATETV